MERAVYDVSPDFLVWKVHRRGDMIHTGYHTKDQAIAAAQFLAQLNRPAQVLVHLANGQIETEWNYGNDPVPAQG